jgi:hypothetical protein
MLVIGAPLSIGRPVPSQVDRVLTAWPGLAAESAATMDPLRLGPVSGKPGGETSSKANVNLDSATACHRVSPVGTPNES